MKAQTTVFVFLFALALLLIIGIMFAFMTRIIHHSGKELTRYKFIESIKEQTKGMAYGERRIITINLPASIIRLCFYDRMPLGENINQDEFTPYLKALFNNTDKNVAIQKKDKTYQTFKIDKLKIRDAYIKCYDNKGIIHLTAESIGNGQFILN